MRKRNLAIMCIASSLPLALFSCAQGGEEASSSVAGASISVAELPEVAVGEKLDLSPYVTAYDGNGAAVTDWTVSSEAANVRIYGQTVYATEVGNYELTAASGDQKATFTLVANDSRRQELSDFLAPLADTPINYTVRLYASMEYQETFFHNEDYAVIVAEDDPYSGSAVIAELADGKDYFGEIVEGEDGNWDAAFSNGWVTKENYVFFVPLSISASSLTYTESDGEVILLSDASFERLLLFYGAAQRPESNGYPLAGARYDGLYDTDGEGEKDTAYFNCLITYSGSSVSYCTLALSDIGTTEVSCLEAAKADEAYVPALIDSSDITSAFAKLDETKSYTVTTKLYSADEDGNEVSPASSSSDLMCSFFEDVTYWESTQTYDADGVISTLKVKTADFSGSTAVISDATLADEYAIFDDGSKTYEAHYDASSAAMGAKTEVLDSGGASIASAYDSDALKAVSLSSIGTDVISLTNWTARTVSNGVTTYTGAIGDNIDDADHSNALFGALLDLPGFAITTQSGNELPGSFLTERRKYVMGGYYTYTSESDDYSTFTVNPSTGEITIKGVIARSGYTYPIGFEITTSAIGATTNDYTAFA